MSWHKTAAEFIGWSLLACGTMRAGYAGENRQRIYNSDTFIELKRGWFYDRLVYDTNRDGEGVLTFVYSIKPIYVKPIYNQPRPAKEYD